MIITVVQLALKFFPKNISQKIQISSSGIFMIFTLKLHFNKKVKDIGMPKKREDLQCGVNSKSTNQGGKSQRCLRILECSVSPPSFSRL